MPNPGPQPRASSSGLEARKQPMLLHRARCRLPWRPGLLPPHLPWREGWRGPQHSCPRLASAAARKKKASEASPDSVSSSKDIAQREAAPEHVPQPQEAAAAAAAVDLRRHAPRGQLWEGSAAAAALPQRWLAFSDLHVSHRTLATCLQVLERVHEEAAKQQAGILFLGDFWHTRGTLPVEPLNEVALQLAQWRQPTLMLPGNHDQVSLGGEVHALTALALSNPAIHAFDGPALFLNALWLPYRRRKEELEAALAAAAAESAAAAAELAAGTGSGGLRGEAGNGALLQAVFAHTDIIGAMMNEQYQAHDGLPPDLFPPDIPTYTGHYHKPHTVRGTRITYVGSPYQVTRAEAGQQKRLLLLDRSAGWQVAEELPLDLGPRYFAAAAIPAGTLTSGPQEVAAAAAEGAEAAAASPEVAAEGEFSTGSGSDSEGAAALAEGAPLAGEEAAAAAAAAFELQLPEGLRAGDRLLLTLPAAAAKQHQQRLKKLEKQGIEVEVFTPPEALAAPRISVAEGMGPLQVWERYCGWQRLSPGAAATGAGVLRTLLGGASSASGAELERPHIDLQFEALELEGYFSFRDAVRYQLADRGLVVVTGLVQESGVESNGAGKSALTMAPLWALTGSTEARSEGGAGGGRGPKLEGIVNDSSKRARVRVEGRVNGRPFVVERTANRKSSSVVFELEGEELTTQENRLTQERINRELGAELLGRVVFYGQNDVNALLEASDRGFKEELSKLVDLDLWEAAKEHSRAEISGRKQALQVAAAKLEERQRQLATAQQQLAPLQQAAEEWEVQAAAAAAGLRQEAVGLLGQLKGQQADMAVVLEAGRQQAAELEAEMAQMESQLDELLQRQQALEEQAAAAGKGGAELAAAEARLAEAQQAQRDLAEQQQRQQFDLGAASSAAADAARQLASARLAASSAAAELAAYRQQYPVLPGSDSSASAELERLLEKQQVLLAQLQQRESALVEQRMEAAGQRSQASLQQLAADKLRQEAAAAQAVADMAREAAAELAVGTQAALTVQQARKQQQALQRRLAAAERRLGVSQGLAREQRRQVDEYLLLSGSTGRGSSASNSSIDGGDSREDSSRHEHAEGAVCDRCSQPISQQLFEQNLRRLAAAAEAAESAAAREQGKVGQLQQELVQAAAAVEMAQDRQQQAAEVAAAEAAAEARAAAAVSAAEEAAAAAEVLAATEAATAAAEKVLVVLQEAAQKLEDDIQEAHEKLEVHQQYQQLQEAADAASAAVSDAEVRQQAAEQQTADAAAALQALEASLAEAAATVTACQERLQALKQGSEGSVQLVQQVQLVQAKRQQVEQRQRALAEQLATAGELVGGGLPSASSDLVQLCGEGAWGKAVGLEDSSAREEERLVPVLAAVRAAAAGNFAAAASEGTAGHVTAGTAGTAAAGWSSGTGATDIAAPTGEAGLGKELDLGSVLAAARATLAAAADLRQRWDWQQQQPNPHAASVALLTQQAEAAAAQVTQVESERAELEDELAVWKQVDDAFKPSGVQNFVVEGVLGDLQAATAHKLSALTSGISLTLSPCKPAPAASKRKKRGEGAEGEEPAGATIEQIAKIVHVRQPGSLELIERSIQQLSGGERKRLALALALGFSELAAQRGRLRSNLIVLDEVMQHLDGEGCLRVAQLLKQLDYSSILVVAQAHSLLTQAFDATDVVVKSGGCSTVEQGSSAAVS